MIQLYLNNHQVVVNDNTSIKLMVENPYFSQSDSYTYDVSLPMTSDLNRRLLGHINRRDVKKSAINMSAKLYADGRLILDGHAVVLSVSDTEVKIQLLGAASFYNSDNKEREVYIDELNLGQWPWFGSTEESAGGTPGLRPGADGEFHGTPAVGDSYENVLKRILSGDNEYVMFPVENSNTGEVCNFFCFRSQNTMVDYRLDYTTFRKRSRVNDNEDHQFRDSYQPMLWYAVKLIAEATGKKLADEDNYFKNNSLLRRIFIASCYPSTNKADAFPHWTVTDWWHNIEQAFGVVVVMDETSDRMRIEPRNIYYSDAPRIYVVKVEDSYSVDIDDESSADLSVSNVGFADHDGNPYETVAQDIIKQSKIDTTYNDLSDLYRALKDENSKLDVYEKYCNHIFRCQDGHEYILSKYIEENKLLIYEINQLGDRIVDYDKEIELEIKFVPCNTVDISVPVYQTYQKSDGSGVTIINNGEVIVRALSRPERDADEPFTNAVEDLIEGETTQSNDDKPDVCYMALLGGYDNYETEVQGNKKNFNYPRGWVQNAHSLDLNDGLSLMSGGYSLSLKKIKNLSTLYSETVQDAINVDVRIKQCFKFLSNSIPDPSAVFVIENKTYLCRQLEVDISGNGMSKLITGYFYHVDL